MRLALVEYGMKGPYEDPLVENRMSATGSPGVAFVADRASAADERVDWVAAAVPVELQESIRELVVLAVVGDD